MKKLLLLAISCYVIVNLYSQSQGISYQALIIDQDPMEVPGGDITGNILPDHSLLVRFTILDAAGTIEFKEQHATTTDEYGMINLMIGQGTQTATSPKTFTEIDWDGTPKSLKVDISFSDTAIFFSDFSYEELTFVPYAYHKNITATGTLIVDGVSSLKSRLNVTGGSPTFLSGDLTVDKTTTLKDNLTVDAASSLKGQVTINADVNGDSDSLGSYPLRVEGSNQGIAVKIDTSRSSKNYFVSFWDTKGMQGRIEGQTLEDLKEDPEYKFDNWIFGIDVGLSSIDVIIAGAEIVLASISSTVCVGLAPCITTPDPKEIIGKVINLGFELAKLALVIAEPVGHNIFKKKQIGVSYQSGAGDYAEWLLKADITEEFYPGDIVGVIGGSITKSTENADHLMVISYNPIVLGNMPEEGKEAEYEKVAFMGQVPVKVIGEVQVGDYILASGLNDGTGIGVSPDDIQPGQYEKIVGTAWSGSESELYGFVNLAVGLQGADLARLDVQQGLKIKEQETEINNLKEQIGVMNAVLEELLPGYDAKMIGGNLKSDSPSTGRDVTPFEIDEERTIVLHGLNREQILEGLDMAEQILEEKGIDVASNPFFEKLHTEPGYKDQFVNDLLDEVKKELDARSEKAMKQGMNVIKQY